MNLAGLLPAVSAIEIGQDNAITGALHQSLLVSMGLPVLCSPICGEGGLKQRSWGNRSSTPIRADVLLTMSLQSLGNQVHFYFYEKEKVHFKIIAAIQGVIFNNCLVKVKRQMLLHVQASYLMALRRRTQQHLCPLFLKHTVQNK